MPTEDIAIIGGGISGLSALHYFRKFHPNKSVRLFEADKRLGGTIGTDQIDGYSFDWGPNGFLDREPLTLDLCHDLGLDDQIERANESVSKRFILRKGKLRSVPMSPPKFMLSDILSVSGRLRVLGEPWAKKRPDGVDESIYDFGKRRIGKEAADYLIQPMVSGVYGGVADRLSLKSCFPIMREMEDEYGSLFKAMIARARAAKRAGKKSGGPSGPGGWLTSFYGGLDRLISAFDDKYGEFIELGHPVLRIKRDANRYKIEFENGKDISAERIVLALPANNAAEITEELSPKLSDSLAAIDYAPISVVCLGFDSSMVKGSVDGFGFLVPQLERLHLLGSIWTSSIFDQRAPEGKVQFRCMVGGDGNHESFNLSEAQLVKIVKEELAEIMKIDGEPEVVKTYRWKYGIPQFKIGHAERIARIEQELSRLGNISVTGNAYYGIGLNDCIKQSNRIASS